MTRAILFKEIESDILQMKGKLFWNKRIGGNNYIPSSGLGWVDGWVDGV